jgi:hypothetical protein
MSQFDLVIRTNDGMRTYSVKERPGNKLHGPFKAMDAVWRCIRRCEREIEAKKRKLCDKRSPAAT